jgi:hypothetical protein
MNPAGNPHLHLAADQQARLRLTPAQEEKVVPILQDEFEQLRELRTDLAATPSHRDRFFLICEARWIREEADNFIEQLLTDAQQRVWEDIRNERRAEMRDEFQRHGSGSAPSHPPPS